MKTLLLTTLFVVLNLTIIAQFKCELSQEMFEGIPQESPVPLNFCFDVAAIQEDCTPVYVRVNVHFFLNDDCQGELAAADYVTEELLPHHAFSLAENLVNAANMGFETMSADVQELNYQWHSAHHGAVVTTSQCIPIRYVLAGVYIHCNTNAQNVGLSFSELNPYEINGTSEVNVYVTDFTVGNGNGFASNPNNDAVVENFTPGLFNHELGHVFSLGHTFDVDGCDDTWDYNWEWDNDCDNTNNVMDDVCWYPEVLVDKSIPEDDIYENIDVNTDGTWTIPPDFIERFCEPQFLPGTTDVNPCYRHPCCEWTAQNNNLMTYSAWGYNPDYSALTPCQISRQLTNLSDEMCDYIADIHEGCPPPNANIGIIPNLTGIMKCPACFYLNASYNESVYILKILNQNGNILLESGEVEEEAGKFCIYPKMDKWGQLYWPYGMTSGQTYTIRLGVYNECGDYDETELNFVLPQPCSVIAQNPDEPSKFKLGPIFPIPIIGNVNIQFDLYEQHEITIYAGHIGSGNFYGVVYQDMHTAQYNQTVQLNTSQWYSGINSLIFQVGNEIQIEQIIKQ